MEPKKTKQANLERKRGSNFIVALLISLSLVLISFEWTSEDTTEEILQSSSGIQVDIEVIQAIPRNEPKSRVKLPESRTVIVPVEEPVLDDLPSFDVEVGPNTIIDIGQLGCFSDEVEEVIEKDYLNVQIMPTFNGGDPGVEFYNYILETLNYPDEAVRNHVEGRVTVLFIVNSKGYVERAEIVKGVHPVLDQEALRVINNSPRWEPGFQNGRNVNVIYTFPISFKLQ